MNEYRCDILNEMTDDELATAVNDRLGDYARKWVKAADEAARYKRIVEMAIQNLEAGVEPRHIIRHMKNLQDELK